jgi:hypothetical protein
MDVVVICSSCARAHNFVGTVPFRAECDGCAADLHTCATCRFHDRFVENECREDQADPVARKDRRNLCEYWKPRQPGVVGDEAATAAKARLAALFGDAAPPASPVGSTAHPTAHPTATAAPAATTSAEAEAKAKLAALFTKKS